MRVWSRIVAAAAAGCCSAVIAGSAATAAEIELMTTGAVEYIMRDLIPPFERASGHKVKMSVFGTVVAAGKIKEGASADLVMLSPEVLGDLEKAGKIAPGTITHAFHSRAGVAVRAGAPKPDVSTVEAFKQTLLNAKSIGHSTGVSGVHFTTTVIPRLGIAEELKPKLKVTPGTPVGAVVARGDVEIGVHQIAELLPIAGIDIVGEFPRELQKTFVYGTGIHANAKEPVAARALVTFISLESSVPAIRKNGMEPAKP